MRTEPDGRGLRPIEAFESGPSAQITAFYVVGSSKNVSQALVEQAKEIELEGWRRDEAAQSALRPDVAPHEVTTLDKPMRLFAFATLEPNEETGIKSGRSPYYMNGNGFNELVKFGYIDPESKSIDRAGISSYLGLPETNKLDCIVGVTVAAGEQLIQTRIAPVVYLAERMGSDGSVGLELCHGKGGGLQSFAFDGLATDRNPDATTMPLAHDAPGIRGPAILTDWTERPAAQTLAARAAWQSAPQAAAAGPSHPSQLSPRPSREESEAWQKNFVDGLGNDSPAAQQMLHRAIKVWGPSIIKRLASDGQVHLEGETDRQALHASLHQNGQRIGDMLHKYGEELADRGPAQQPLSTRELTLSRQLSHQGPGQGLTADSPAPAPVQPRPASRPRRI